MGNTLGNVIASNARKVESGFEVLTGVIRSHRAAGAVDRKLIREQTKAMGKDMQKSISRSIMIGEAKARRVADRARGNLARAKRAMLIEISERVEHTADKLFKTIQGSHQKIADNYLSLKAYAVTAGDKLKDYVIKGKGKNLSSLGDLLTTVAGLSSVKAQKAEGLGAGAKTIPAIFSSRKVKVKAMLTKINGIVNEYTGVINAVRARWPMGLGKYLLLKLGSPCSPRACSRWTRCPTTPVTGCSSTAVPWVSPTSSTTSSPSLCAWATTRLPSLSSLPLSLARSTSPLARSRTRPRS